MIALTLAEIAAVTGGRVHGDDRHRVDAVATDTRSLPSGAPLFVALRGETADGHDHLGAALSGGATAALTERTPQVDLPAVEVSDTWQALRALAAEVRRRVAPRAVGITGSVGKTTVKDLTAAAVGAGRPTHAAVGSFNNELGVPLTLLGLEERHEVLVAEIGARHVGDIADLAPLVAPDLAIVTAVAGVHLEVFGTIDDVARAKRELVEALRPDGVAILNGDDPRVAAMTAAAPAHLLVGSGPGADVTASDVTLDDHARPRFTARTPWGDVEVRVPVAGRHQVANALYALTVAGHLGIDLGVAADGLARGRVSRWRGEVHRTATVTVLDDAYNANPTSVVAALSTLTTLAAGGRSVAVLGVMAEIGATHDAEHARVGAAVVEAGVDHRVVVGDEAGALASGARDAGLAAASVVTVPDADAAIDHLRSVLTEGDTVLVKASRVAGLERVSQALLTAPSDVPGARP